MIEGVVILSGLCCLLTVILTVVFAAASVVNRRYQVAGNAAAASMAEALGLAALGRDRKGRDWYGGEHEGLRYALAYPLTREVVAGTRYTRPMLWLMCETGATAPVGWKASSNNTIAAEQPFERAFYCREPERISQPVRHALFRFALEVGGVRVNDLERLNDWRPPGDSLRSAAVAIHNEIGDEQTPDELRTRLAALAAVARMVTT